MCYRVIYTHGEPGEAVPKFVLSPKKISLKNSLVPPQSLAVYV